MNISKYKSILYRQAGDVFLHLVKFHVGIVAKLDHEVSVCQ